MSDFIPLSVPSIKGNEWKYVKECLDTEWVSSAGKFVDRFEHEIAVYTRSPYAVACVNGSAALHTALIIVGVAAGDEVIVPTLTFIAPINAVRYVNAFPVFMDSDDYYNIDAQKTLAFIQNETEFRKGSTFNKSSGRKISAIIPVHVFGNAVDLDELCHLCRERNIRIVEDATESLGTVYSKGDLTGKHAGTIGDIGCLSFNGNKIITTGGGGMILTANEEYARRAKYLTTQAKDDEVHFLHNDVGYNYRLTNIQAAMGAAQLEQLPAYLEIKKKNYEYYKNRLDAIPGLHLAEVPGYAANNYWMYALRIDVKKYGKDIGKVMTEMTAHKIQTRPVWFLNHLQQPYTQFQSYQIKHADILLKTTINIPCSVNLKPGQIETVIERLAHG